MAKRKKYIDEFKREAVGLIRQPDSKVLQVATNIGVTATLLFHWQRQLDRGSGEGGWKMRLPPLPATLAAVGRARDTFTGFVTA